MINWFINLFREDRTFGVPRSDKWSTVEKNFLKVHPTCELCETKKNLNVHHCLPFHLHPELELDPNNLMTLCRVHHFLFGHFDNWKNYNKDVREDVKIWNNKLCSN